MIQFQSITTSFSVSPWCVDGRPDYSAAKGPQMLGGSLHSLVLQAIATGSEFNKDFIQKGFQTLKNAGYKVGVHRGHHKNADKNVSDCGFGDKTKLIIEKAKANKDDIVQKLLDANRKNGLVFGEEKNVKDLLEAAYTKVLAYDTEQHMPLQGEELIGFIEETVINDDEGDSVLEVEGDHAEEVVFVNLEKGATLDTNGLNADGRQAFNLDLWVAVEQAKALGVEDEGLATGLSLILYQATEMVLVEDKGKPALEILVHS